MSSVIKKIILFVMACVVFMLSACTDEVQNVSLPPLNLFDTVIPTTTATPTETPSAEAPSPTISEEIVSPSPSVNTVTPSPSPSVDAVTPSPSPTQTPTPTPSPSPTATPTPKPSPKPSPSKKPEVEPYQGEVPVFYPTNTEGKPLSGKVIGIDPGHQAKGNSEKEPNAPGSSVMKAKCTTGATGIKTRTLESEINLSTALMLKDYLLEQGATVVMVRDTQNIDISNAQRAMIFNQYEVDMSVRIHCNGSDNSSVKGALMMKPTEHQYKAECYAASDCIIQAVVAETGCARKADLYTSDLTGFNWCERPTTLIEMGFLSNEEEDALLSSTEYQDKMAKGICNGLVAYFNANNA